MKKTLAILIVLSAATYAYADTYSVSETGTCDEVACWDIPSITITAPSTAQANTSIIIGVTRNAGENVYPQESRVLVAMGSNWHKECDKPGLPACTYAAITTAYVGDGSGGNPTVVGGGLSSGTASVNTGGASSYGIDINTYTTGISCETFGGGGCQLLPAATNIPLTVSSASVQLNISSLQQLLGKLFNSVFAAD